MEDGATLTSARGARNAECEMNGCIESSPLVAFEELDQMVEALLPSVEALLRRIADDASVATEPDEGGYRSSVPVRFPDGVGRGFAVARLFRYRDTVRLDVELEHNRMLAKPDGTPSDRRCYLNDYVASATLAAGTPAIPVDFERTVVRGILKAREAVQRHNREQQAPWGQVSVVAV